MPNQSAPFHPIIYVRGYAMTEREQDETSADPFCGFNLGSTVYRATPEKDKPAKKFIFESPVLRLTSDYGYSDIYENVSFNPVQNPTLQRTQFPDRNTGRQLFVKISYLFRY